MLEAISISEWEKLFYDQSLAIKRNEETKKNYILINADKREEKRNTQTNWLGDSRIRQSGIEQKENLQIIERYFNFIYISNFPTKMIIWNV